MELITLARQAQEKAYAPYSDFKVGAALLCRDGTIFTGCNIENASYGACNCAERTAIFKAVSDGHTDFEKIAITSSGGILTFPCGICRQVMSEFSTELRIVLCEDGKEPECFMLCDLLPHSFKL